MPELRKTIESRLGFSERYGDRLGSVQLDTPELLERGWV